MKKWIILISVLCLVGCISEGEPLDISFNPVSIHDPSIIKRDDMYYVFGSHIEAAKSSDLMNWETFANGYTTPENALYGDLSANLSESFLWAGKDDADSRGGFSVWAPEIIWNPNFINKDGSQGAYMLYYSVSSTYIRSAIGFAVSTQIKGPFTYVDTIVYSGFTKEAAYDEHSVINIAWDQTHHPTLIEQGVLEDINPDWFNEDGSYRDNMYPNAIDANVFYDTEQRLWMSYGSWSGGIFLLELDPKTGRPIFPGTDSITQDGRLIDRYFGTKISGGYGQSGEGPYIIYDQITGYYYLYVTYGWLGADGGYNMRVFRSTEPTGPYLDIKGEPAVLAVGEQNFMRGNKLMGNFHVKEENNFGFGYVSPGHNSVLQDEQKGKQFLVFHTRFPNAGEMHQMRVHQLFMTQENWPVVAVHPYVGETLKRIRIRDIIGNYQFINHGIGNATEIVESLEIQLNRDGTITGDIQGTWRLISDYFAEITINDVTYRGVFSEGWNQQKGAFVTTFTAISDRGVSIWGTK